MNSVINVNAIMGLIPTIEAENPELKIGNDFDLLLENLLNKDNKKEEKDENIEISLPIFYNQLINILAENPIEIEENQIDLKPQNAKDVDIKIGPLEITKDESIEKFKEIEFESFKGTIKTIMSKSFSADEIEKVITSVENIVINSETQDNKLYVNKKEMFESIKEIIRFDENKIDKTNVLEKINAFIRKDEIKTEKINTDVDSINIAEEKVLDKPIIVDNNSKNLDFKFEYSKNVEKKPEKTKTPVFEFNVSVEPNVKNEAPIINKDKMIEVVENKIIQHTSLIETEGNQEFEVQLKPEFLGKITIKLEKSDEGVKVKIATSNFEVKEALSNQVTHITENLKTQGVDLQNAEIVYTGLANQNHSFGSENRFKGNAKKSLNNAKDEYEKAVISGVSEVNHNGQINLNGNLNYLV